MNIIFRICLECKQIKNENGFMYMGQGIWKCQCCLSMYTEIYEIKHITKIKK